MQEVMGWLKCLIEINFIDSVIYSSMLFCIMYISDFDLQVFIIEYCKFGECYGNYKCKCVVVFLNLWDLVCKLQVGFVLGDLFSYVVVFYVVFVIEYFVVDFGIVMYFYYNYFEEDYVFECFKVYVMMWCIVVGMSDMVFFECVCNDCIDIVIDLLGYIGCNWLVVLVQCVVFVQVLWIGYLVMMGFVVMDYYLVDCFFVLYGQFEDQFVEWIVWLFVIVLFMLLVNCLFVNVLFVLYNGYMIYGSFNCLNKLSLYVIVVWVCVLYVDLIVCMVFGVIGNEGDQQMLIEWFVVVGIDVSCLLFYWCFNIFVYMQQYYGVDFCFDMFLYMGLMIMLNGLWMGVLILMIFGLIMVGCGSVSWLQYVGCDVYIVNDEDDFVVKVLVFSSDIIILQVLCVGLCVCCLVFVVFWLDVVVVGLLLVLCMMWVCWCVNEFVIVFDMLLFDDMVIVLVVVEV